MINSVLLCTTGTSDKMSKDQYAAYRIVGSLITLTIHLTQMSAMSAKVKEVIPQHPELQKMEKLGPRYVTVWNLTLQILYAAFTIYLDVRTLLSKSYVVSEGAKKFRYTIFAGLVFPIATGIPLTFWPCFLYDRDLVFPLYADLMVSFSQNLMAHGGIFLYALWELVFLPRDSIKHDLKTFVLTLIFCFTYVASLFYTRYVEPGVWCYQLMERTEGTPLFFFAFSGPTMAALLGYYTQWQIKDALWKKRDGKKED